MISAIMLSTLLSFNEAIIMPPEKPVIEARKRGKRHKDRRRGGNGLR